MSSLLPQPIRNMLDKICQGNYSLTFWNYYKTPSDHSRKWVDLTLHHYNDDDNGAKNDPATIFLDKDSTGGAELKELAQDDDGEYGKALVVLKELVEMMKNDYKWEKIRIFKHEDYCNTWGGGWGRCQVVVFVEGKFVFYSTEDGDW